MADLLPFESLGAERFKPGDRAIWNHVPRGGYGYIEPIPVVVVRVTAKRVTIEVPLARGGTKRVSVHPMSLGAAPSPSPGTTRKE